MDSEKFDKVVLDLLYDELDELTRASAIRHLEQSGRAKALYSELKATRDVGALPLVEPPPDLERRILAAEANARAVRPLRQRFGTLVSIVASYAMRPQVGMAALLMLMLGSSLLFLRAKPGEPNRVLVTERGVPETERETVAIVPAPSLATAAEAPPPPEPARASKTSRGPEAPRSELALGDVPARAESRPSMKAAGAAADKAGDLEQGFATGAGAAAPPAAAAPAPVANERSMASQAKKEAPAAEPAGCAASLPHYEEVRAHPSSPSAGYAATWAAAECYREMGAYDRARSAYSALLTVADYGDQARRALADLPAGPAARARTAPAAAAKPAATAEP